MGMGDFFAENFTSDNELIILPQIPGSIMFTTTGSWLTVPSSSDWAMGTGDFTAEWYQYQTDISGNGGTYQRVFTVGNYPNASLAISIESGMMLCWMQGNTTAAFQVTLNNFLNNWVHFAFVRRNSNVNVYQNGTSIAGWTSSANISDSTASMNIGAEANDSFETIFQGYITNLHIVKGTALYTSSFIPPTKSIQPVAGTKLLLNVMSPTDMLVDSSGTNKVVTNQGAATWRVESPYV